MFPVPISIQRQYLVMMVTIVIYALFGGISQGLYAAIIDTRPPLSLLLRRYCLFQTIPIRKYRIDET